jgi:hypothetical protein
LKCFRRLRYWKSKKHPALDLASQLNLTLPHDFVYTGFIDILSFLSTRPERIFISQYRFGLTSDLDSSGRIYLLFFVLLLTENRWESYGTKRIQTLSYKNHDDTEREAYILSKASLNWGIIMVCKVWGAHL